jgi:ketosteroid isomerase-like protein
MSAWAASDRHGAAHVRSSTTSRASRTLVLSLPQFPDAALSPKPLRRVPILAALICAALLNACAAPAPRDISRAEREVADTERAFAKTMADRDFAAFKLFLSDDTIFFSGPTPLRGKQRVADFWQRFYEKPEAPFSWQPEQVQVLESGELALSTGPVRNAQGKLFATFTSIWRREAPGQWRIVFDKGAEICDCAKP